MGKGSFVAVESCHTSSVDTDTVGVHKPSVDANVRCVDVGQDDDDCAGHGADGEGHDS